MNATMARKKTAQQGNGHSARQKPGRKPSGIPQARESFNLPQELQDALVAYVDDFKREHEGAKTDKTTVIVAALAAYLRGKGYWPWPRTGPAAYKEQEE